MSGDETIISGLAGRYATALFELADADQSLDKIAGDLDVIKQLINESSDLSRLLHSPAFTRQQQSAAMAAVLERAGVGGLTAKFVGLVASNRRLFALEQMIGGYRALLARHRGEVTAQVASARPLSQAQLDQLSDALRAAMGRDVSLETEIEPELIGGLTVRVGSRMVDNSLRTKLKNLEVVMKEVG